MSVVFSRHVINLLTLCCSAEEKVAACAYAVAEHPRHGVPAGSAVRVVACFGPDDEPLPLADGRAPQTAVTVSTTTIRVDELNDGLLVYAWFLATDSFGVTASKNLNLKAWWSFSATVATRNPSAPYRFPPQWETRLSMQKMVLPVGDSLPVQKPVQRLLGLFLECFKF